MSKEAEDVLLAIYTACTLPEQFLVKQPGQEIEGLREERLYFACQLMGMNNDNVAAILAFLADHHLIYRSASDHPRGFDACRRLRMTSGGAAFVGLLLARQKIRG